MRNVAANYPTLASAFAQLRARCAARRSWRVLRCAVPAVGLLGPAVYEHGQHDAACTVCAIGRCVCAGCLLLGDLPSCAWRAAVYFNSLISYHQR
eukprot:1554244-Prymnesium_polylepis.1